VDEWMDGCGRNGESANDEEEKLEKTAEETITTVFYLRLS
jgi:hypothetical protein